MVFEIFAFYNLIPLENVNLKKMAFERIYCIHVLQCVCVRIPQYVQKYLLLTTQPPNTPEIILIAMIATEIMKNMSVPHSICIAESKLATTTKSKIMKCNLKT